MSGPALVVLRRATEYVFFEYLAWDRFVPVVSALLPVYWCLIINTGEEYKGVVGLDYKLSVVGEAVQLGERGVWSVFDSRNHLQRQSRSSPIACREHIPKVRPRCRQHNTHTLTTTLSCSSILERQVPRGASMERKLRPI